ncbi:conserved hypothetical protein [anaerobic digester metagenome]|uniref:Hydrolase n=1 Tax=anaerobic digester metagenome TaxID=1263854 RepID=A0A485M4M1_9ZZZZ
MEGRMQRLQSLIGPLLDAIRVFERVERMFHPAMIPRHGEALNRKADELLNARQAFFSRDPDLPSGDAEDAVIRAVDLVVESARIFSSSEGLQSGIFAAMRAMRKACRAKEALFGLRGRVEEIDSFFREAPPRSAKSPGHDLKNEDCLIHTGVESDPYARGASSLFVPASPAVPGLLPVVIALHGGSGHGRDFLWTWIREARTRGFILLAPTSVGPTWHMEDPLPDLRHILRQVERASEHYAADTSRMLLTGLSDGATFALRCAMLPSTPFSAFAPVSGVLPPGEISGAAGRRIYWIHGAYDWMFPPERARQGSSRLIEAGAEVTLKVIENLAHAHPREENGGILTWFDPGLCLP